MNVCTRELVFARTEIERLLQVIYDRDNGRSRGFAFVTMASEEEARVAIEKLDGLVGYHFYLTRVFYRICTCGSNL